MLRLSGIFPAPRECPLCERPLLGPDPSQDPSQDPGEAARAAVLPAGEEFLVCPACAGPAGSSGLAVEADVLRFLELIGRRRLVRLARKPPDRDTLRRTERLAAEVRRRFLGRELRSYGVIRSLSPTLTAPPETP